MAFSSWGPRFKSCWGRKIYHMIALYLWTNSWLCKLIDTLINSSWLSMRLNNLIAGHITNWTKKKKMDGKRDRKRARQTERHKRKWFNLHFFLSFSKLTSKFTWLVILRTESKMFSLPFSLSNRCSPPISLKCQSCPFSQALSDHISVTNTN